MTFNITEALENFCFLNKETFVGLCRCRGSMHKCVTRACVCVSQGRCAEDLYKGIQNADSGVRCDSLKQLADVSTDITFAQEFISRDGHSLLVQIVEEDKEYVPPSWGHGGWGTSACLFGCEGCGVDGGGGVTVRSHMFPLRL